MRGLTHAEIVDLLRLQLPDPSECRFRFDRPKILAALAMFDIELPMIVALRTYRPHNTGWLSYGKHYARREPTLHHEIRLNKNLLTHHANRVFWHELAHAMQAERWVKEKNADIKSRGGIRQVTIANFYSESYRHAKGPHGASYARNRYELEAEEIADTYAPTIEGQLIRENQ